MVRCTVCGRREAIYVRAYSGEKICKRCFIESIENKVRVTIAKYQMFSIDDKIAIAVSGGKDSLSLLHILAKIEGNFPKTSLSAITVDEGISGYRDEAVKLASENCNNLGIQLKTVSFRDICGYTLDEIVKKTEDGKLTSCAYCGVLRRRALNVAAREAGASKIATAHNLDDEIQTFLLNIMHGDPLRIVRSEPVSDLRSHGLVQRVKPMCEVLEKEVALHAWLKKISFQDLPCPYAGAALRNDMRNTLNRLEEKHPGTKYTVYRSMEKMRQAMKGKTEETPMKTCTTCGELTTGITCQTCQILHRLQTM